MKIARTVVVALSFALALSAVAQAQGAAFGLDNVRTASALARQALECLQRGEDAVTQEEKLAAYKQGLDLAKRAVEADDSNADAHFALFANNGRLMLLKGATPNPLNLLRASAELERTLQIDPDYADALAARGGLYRQLPWMLGGNLDKAEADLVRAVELNPVAVGARIELARTYRDKGTPERGRSLLEEAVRLADEQHRPRESAEARRLLHDLGAPR